MTDSTTAGAASAALSDPGAAPPALSDPGAAPPAPLTTASAPLDWIKDWSAEDKGFIEKKGYKDPADLFKAYKSLASKIGEDPVVFPKDPADAKANAEFRDGMLNRLGRPEASDKYQFSKEADPDFVKAMAPLLHKAGARQDDIGELEKGFNEFSQQKLKQQQDTWLADQDEAMRKLSVEWGNDNPAQLERARRAQKALGITMDEANTFMRGGTEKFMKLLSAAGRALGEDNSGGIVGDAGSFGVTPNRAAFELQKLRENKDFMTRYAGGDKNAAAQYNHWLKQTEGVKRTIGDRIR